MDNRQRPHHEGMKNSVGRFIFAGLAVLVQLLWFAFIILKLSESYLWVSIVLRMLTTASVIGLFGRHTNSSIKLSWIVFIMAVPVLGWVFYVLSYRLNFVHTMSRRFKAIDSELFSYLPENDWLLAELGKENRGVGNQAYFLKNSAGFPVYRNTEVKYYGDAGEGLLAQKEALSQAEHFIFMEYHAIEVGQSFGELLDILAERAAAGVEVRIFYDEVGSVGFLSRGFVRRMEELGISCRVFNPITMLPNFFMNNRDHRKITVIDGKVGFTGGYNLADKYFNIESPYGHWKDSGLRLRGEAVQCLTMLFLEMWNAMEPGRPERVEKYLGTIHKIQDRPMPSGYVIPFGDTPLDELHTGEDVYLNMLKNAKSYVYIMTPYLILTDDMIRELTLAARRGVEVRIITPGIPDKPLIYQMTRSYYNQLCRHGVRVFEYAPGFCHAKQMVCDDELAVVGTINLDYRSLYHHFENAVLLYGCECIEDIRQDFTDCFLQSREVTEHYRSGRSRIVRIVQCVLRLFAPLT